MFSTLSTPNLTRSIGLELPYTHDRRRLRILLIGGGGRESVLASKLIMSDKVARVFVMPGNGGTANMGSKVENIIGRPVVSMDGTIDYNRIRDLAQEYYIDLCVPGPDTFAAENIKAIFEEAKIPCFCPSKEAVQLVASRAFAKEFMKKYKIPTADYRIFTSYEEAERCVRLLYQNQRQFVIKVNGLTPRTGVVQQLCRGGVMYSTLEKSLQELKDIMLRGKFGTAGEQVVIEEHLYGPQISILTFSDGITFKSLPPAYKEQMIFLDGLGGQCLEATGGYAPVTLSRTFMQAIEDGILKPTFEGLKLEKIGGLRLGTPFVGVLSTRIALVDGRGPRVLEYNARFGELESQVLLPLLSSKTELIDIVMACLEHRLTEQDIQVEDKSCAVVGLFAYGFPDRCLIPQEVVVNNISNIHSLRGQYQYFHADTSPKLFNYNRRNRILTSGGHVVAVSAVSDTLEEAVKLAYAGAEVAHFRGKFYGFLIFKDALEKLKQPNKVSLLHSRLPEEDAPGEEKDDSEA